MRGAVPHSSCSSATAAAPWRPQAVVVVVVAVAHGLRCLSSAMIRWFRKLREGAAEFGKQGCAQQGIARHRAGQRGGAGSRCCVRR